MAAWPTRSEHAQRPAGSGFAGPGSPALVVVVVAIAALSLGWRASSSSSDPSSSPAVPVHVSRRERSGSLSETGGPDSTGRLGLSAADGAVPDVTTVFDEAVPGVARLNSDLLDDGRRAAPDATGDGIRFTVDSSWRSPEYQERLLREAISKYGSEAEATRWVATPTTSAHVKGDAVDIGLANAASWLSGTAPHTGCARSTTTSPGTTSCAPRPSLTLARPRTPTQRTTHGCSVDQQRSRAELHTNHTHKENTNE